LKKDPQLLAVLVFPTPLATPRVKKAALQNILLLKLSLVHINDSINCMLLLFTLHFCFLLSTQKTLHYPQKCFKDNIGAW